MRYCLYIAFSLLTLQSLAQEIKIGDFKPLPLDISARENPVFDANGDACAIIKVRTGLDSLRFSGDLEIRKVEKHEGEYWLWVSPMTQKLNIITENYGDIVYELPLYTTVSSVYTMYLLVSLPDKIVIKESHTAAINTRPKKAQVFINDIFMGNSPLIFASPVDTFSYVIRKHKYNTATGFAILSDGAITVPVRLQRDPAASRLFLTLYTGSNDLGTMFYGFKAGKLGKTGWYISLASSFRNEDVAVTTYEPYSFGSQQTDFLTTYNFAILNYLTGLPSGSYYMKLKENNNSFYNHNRIKAGVTQRIGSNLFINVGLGYASSERFYEFIVVPYTNEFQPEVPLELKLFAKDHNPLKGLAIDAGLAIRFLNQFLINIDFSPFMYKNTLTNKMNIMPELILGIGYSY